MKKIGILGSGQVAKALANGFAAAGYDVMMGTRELTKLEEFKNQVSVKVSTFENAAAHGEIIVLAVKGSVANSAIALAGIDHLTDKLILDTTNPISDLAPVNGVLSYFTAMDNSLMEQLQRQAPRAHFVKCWNSVGNAYMINPDFGGVRPTMFICGNSEAAKQETSEILNEFGWDAEDMGKVESARAIEPLCILWCAPGFLRNQWTHAFKLLKK